MNQSTASQHQEFTPENILQRLFDLTPKQSEIFQYIRKIGTNGICIMGLTNYFNVDRSVMQKTLQVLLKKQLIHRELVTLNEFNRRCQINFQKEYEHETITGALYLYVAESPELMHERIYKRLMCWKGIIDQYF